VTTPVLWCRERGRTLHVESFERYAGRKAALRSFPHTWTSALQDRKIRVNVLNSGGIATAAQHLLPPGAQEIYAEDGFLRKPRW